MRILISVALWTCVFLLRQNVANAVECKAISIQFDPSGLLQLTNCTSIIGSLTIHSIDDFRNNTDINKYQFPKLKEITGYLLIFNVKGLTSPGQLFPNLMVIRGKELAMSFSLVLFGNPDMAKVDLKSLISIQRGYVLIKQCPGLCYHNTVDWEALTDEDEDDLPAGKGNVIQATPKQCPSNESCRACENDKCWTSINCQRSKKYFKNMTKRMKGITCHKSCLGGCVNATASGCDVCTKLTLNGTCVDECPSDLIIFRDTMRCITKIECMKEHRLIPFNGECRSKCPVSYSNYHPDTKAFHPFECFACEIKCISRCPGSRVLGPSDLEQFRECTVVDGSLYINLGSNMTDIYQILEQTLGNIETINGVLTIFRSFSLTSLAFFRNLNKIKVQNITSTVKGNDELSDEYQRLYGLEIYENDNLQTLFNWKETQQLEIIGGGMFIHYNSKLCMNEVHNLQNITVYDRTHESFGYSTNGYDESCQATRIYAFHIVNSYSDVQIYWNISDFGSNRRLIGYFVYYIEAPSQNITYFSGLDACSTKKTRSTFKESDLPMISKAKHGDVWQSVFVPFGDLKRVKGYYQMNVTNLKQYTQYAYYVRTQLSLQLKDQLINVTQGQSPVKYFKTLPDRPRPPIVRTKQKTNESITLEWIPSTPETELVERYFIDVYAIIDDVNELNKRDYCQNPKVKVEQNEIETQAPKVICCRDQRAYLDFFKRNANQTCGESDSSCEKTFKFVVFHHHVESVLMKVDAAKHPSERHSIYRHKQEPFEAPPHHKHGTTDPIIRKNESDSTRYYLHSHIIDDKYLDGMVVPNLKPFHLYAFHVYACNIISNCSDYYFHSERTEPSPSTNDVSIKVNADDSDIVTFTVSPPAEPNSYVVAYQIHKFFEDSNRTETMCFTRKAMESTNYTFRIENLAIGAHFFRIRSISIGSNGLFSTPAVIIVEPPDYSLYIWGVVLAISAIVLILFVCCLYSPIQKRLSRQAEDKDLLLPKDDSSDADEPEQPPSFHDNEGVRILPGLHDVVAFKNMKAGVTFDDSLKFNFDSSSNESQSTMQEMLKPTTPPTANSLLSQNQGTESDSDYGEEDYALFN
ncbi:insulin-like peptide receptor [Bradysia coprophila]|uniref:insulin-like peptide receptor n=1 Tax=Bradysia coprophila TaxID=38358 RepID=UPI00187DD8C1|nr:insulin-like peptide receptor [Bradysia coprophila]